MARAWMQIAMDFSASVNKAVEVLDSGGVVVFPTETVYGIGVDAANSEAMRRLRTLKGRDADKPFQLLIADITMGTALGGRFSAGAFRVATEYWPGPLTLVVPDRGSGTLGLRVPDNAFVLAVIQRFGRAVATSSSNPGGKAPPVTADDADAFGSMVDLLLDGGRCAVGTASTVVIATQDGGFTIAREGAISRQEIGERWNAGGEFCRVTRTY